MPEALAVDRAEYSLRQGTIVIALVLGGVALVGMGMARLRRVALHEMPRAVALVIASLGLAVVAFGLFFVRADVTEQEPRVTLEPATSAEAPVERGDVHGVVKNTDGEAVANVKVDLQSRFAMGESARALTTTSADDGTFVFRNVPIDPGQPWAAVAHYDGARFTSEVLREPRTRSHGVTIVVAPVGRESGVLQVDAQSLALVGDTGGMQAVNAVDIRNTSERAFWGTVEFPVAAGGTAIDPRSGLDRPQLSIDEDGQMTSRAPVLPGRHEVTYTYVAPLERSATPLAVKITYPTRRFDVLIGGKLAFAPQSPLQRNGKVTLAGRKYARYTATHLRPDDVIAGRITVVEPSRLPRVLAPILAVAAAIGIILIPTLRRRRRVDGPRSTEPEPQPVEWT